MNSKIESEIRAFEALQKSSENLGALDSEPDYIFQLVIARAISKESVDIDLPIEWDLYDEAGAEDAAALLTAQAWKVYRVIQSFAQPADVTELKKYCWRIDDAEFEST
ncbi:MAG: hypothetical protein U1E10_02075 [Bdellovibrionales bacterium]|nr:hypothetical protein [Bdellovibrionales bacterium]